jgi:hypothetical protein
MRFRNDKGKNDMFMAKSMVMSLDMMRSSKSMVMSLNMMRSSKSIVMSLNMMRSSISMVMSLDMCFVKASRPWAEYRKHYPA